MDLHHTTGKPDWESRNHKDYNVWQRVAAKTNGMVTLPNFITMAGFVAVLVSLLFISHHSYWAATILLIIGRLCDIADGYVAEKTSTKGPVGEKLDAIIDKIGGFLTLLIFYIAHVAPLAVLIAILLPQTLISGQTVYYLRNNIHLQPSRYGKLSMAASWLALFGFIIIRASHMQHFNLFTGTVYFFVIVGVILGLYASLGYTKNTTR